MNKVICGQLGGGGALLAIDTATGKLVYSTDGSTWEVVQPAVNAGSGVAITGGSTGQEIAAIPIQAGNGISISAGTGGQIVAANLVAGSDITITAGTGGEMTIAFAGTSLEAGDYLAIADGVIDCTLSAGAGISISNAGAISADVQAVDESAGLSLVGGTVAIDLVQGNPGLYFDVSTGRLGLDWDEVYATFTNSDQGLFVQNGLYVELDIPALKTALELS